MPRRAAQSTPKVAEGKIIISLCCLLLETLVVFFSPIIFYFFNLHLVTFAFSSLHLPSLERLPKMGLGRFFAIPPARPGPAGAGSGFRRRLRLWRDELPGEN